MAFAKDLPGITSIKGNCFSSSKKKSQAALHDEGLSKLTNGRHHRPSSLSHQSGGKGQGLQTGSKGPEAGPNLKLWQEQKMTLQCFIEAWVYDWKPGGKYNYPRDVASALTSAASCRRQIWFLFMRIGPVLEA
jgi:hypothetical protein